MDISSYLIQHQYKQLFRRTSTFTQKLGIVLSFILTCVIVFQIVFTFIIVSSAIQKNTGKAFSVLLSEFFIFYYFIGLVFRLLLQRLPLKNLKPYFILNVKKRILAKYFYFISCLNSNNLFALLFNILATLLILFREKPSFNMGVFFFNNIILTLMLSAVVSIYRLFRLHWFVLLIVWTIVLLSVIILIDNLTLVSEVSKKVFYITHSHWTNILYLFIVNLLIQQIYFNKILKKMYLE